MQKSIPNQRENKEVIEEEEKEGEEKEDKDFILNVDVWCNHIYFW